MRKKWSSDRKKPLKFQAEGQEFAFFLQSQKHFIQTVKGQTNFGNRIFFKLVPGGLSHLKLNLEKNIGIQISAGKFRKLLCTCVLCQFNLFIQNTGEPLEKIVQNYNTCCKCFVEIRKFIMNSFFVSSCI